MMIKRMILMILFLMIKSKDLNPLDFLEGFMIKGGNYEF